MGAPPVSPERDCGQANETSVRLAVDIAPVRPGESDLSHVVVELDQPRGESGVELVVGVEQSVLVLVLILTETGDELRLILMMSENVRARGLGAENDLVTA